MGIFDFVLHLVEVGKKSPLVIVQYQLSELGSANLFYSYLHRVIPYPNLKMKNPILHSKKVKNASKL